MSSIFVQIASYRDLELLPTIRDCFKKASGKHKLTFGLVWQKDETETIEEYSSHPDVRIISVPWQESKGLGWARSLTQSMYENEDYTLQLDSHHRFAENWDTTLIDMLEKQKELSKKPLLTAYATGYDPLNDTVLNAVPCRVLPQDFKSSGTIWFNPNPIPNYQMLSGPIMARFVSGHYFFVDGKHCKEYVYDPDLYFAGDEIALSVRSFTLGYDLYHPHINVVWHHYGRLDRTKHWTDHTDDKKKEGIVEKTWHDRDVLSKKRIRQLLGEEDNGIDLGIYGLGKERSIQEYERYAGIDFKNKRIQLRAISGENPPMSFRDEAEWNEGFIKRTPITIIDLPKDQLLPYKNQASIARLEFINLQQKVIHSQILNLSSIFSNNILSTVVTTDYKPMRYIITLYDSLNRQLCKVQRDLRPNIHWS